MYFQFFKYPYSNSTDKTKNDSSCPIFLGPTTYTILKTFNHQTVSTIRKVIYS